MAHEPPVTIPVRLTALQRAQLFSQLATMERAGILPARAFSMIGRDLPADMRHALAQTAEALAKGADLAKAGQSGGALLPWEARLARAAATGGRLESLYRRLSEHYASSAQLFGGLKSRLVFPFLILTLATFVAPFPALFQGAIGLGGYLLRAVGPPLLLYGGLRLCNSSIPSKLNAGNYAAACSTILEFDGFRDCSRPKVFNNKKQVWECPLVKIKGLSIRRQSEYRMCMGLQP